LISRIIRDAASTIGRVQDFARQGDERPVAILDLNAIIHQSVDIAKSTLEERNSLVGRSIRVELNVPRLPLTEGEPAELRQVFLNLLLNAQDAMPAGGTIRITGNAEDDKIVIKLEDEGHGIPKENLGRIFDPFFSTKGEKGTGLGLSIASATMGRIGGTISAANRSQGGAVFLLNFPIAAAKSLHNAEDCSQKSEPRRVMVIEDDVDNLQALSALLESKGHTVIRTYSGYDALDKLTCSRIDVIFCDLGMRQVNGWELARQVKSEKHAPVFYLLTGWATEIRPDDPRRDLVDAIIVKPVDPKILDGLLAA
jgi:CheY-like chemotaxis protein